jgi:hypothetical protein
MNRLFGLGLNLSIENTLNPFTENEELNRYVKPSRSMIGVGVLLRYNF